MLSSVLTSERAAQVNIEIIRAFVRLRQMLAAHADLEKRLDASEERYDEQFKVVFDAIRALMKPPEKSRKKIGFEVMDFTSDIVQSIIDIMEGGREAFRVRQNRYGMDLPSAITAGGRK